MTNDFANTPTYRHHFRHKSLPHNHHTFSFLFSTSHIVNPRLPCLPRDGSMISKGSDHLSPSTRRALWSREWEHDHRSHTAMTVVKRTTQSTTICALPTFEVSGIKMRYFREARKGRKKEEAYVSNRTRVFPTPMVSVEPLHHPSAAAYPPSEIA